MKKFILFYRKVHSESFKVIRKIYMKRFVLKLKKSCTNEQLLTKEQKKEIHNYYKNYKNISTIFHNFYYEKTGIYSLNYIPDDIYYNYVNHFYNDHQAAKFIDNKCYYSKMFPDTLQPKTILTRMGGYWFLKNKILSMTEVYQYLQEEDAFFIKKAVDCGGGHGVYYLENVSDSNCKEEFEKIISIIETDIIIQKPVMQHDAISMLNKSSVNTMRILSVLRNGKVKIYSSLLRIGGGKSKVDNYSSGGMSVGIDELGRLKEFGYFADGSRITHHPDSKVEFKGYQLPSFYEAQELVKVAHCHVPHFKMVSWDIAINQEGNPVLIEANLSDGQLDFHQLNNGPLFGEDTRIILDEVFSK